jgi:hypothetical protein
LTTLKAALAFWSGVFRTFTTAITAQKSPAVSGEIHRIRLMQVPLRTCAPHEEQPDVTWSLRRAYRHLIIMIDALPKTKGTEKLVPMVVALNPLP